MNASPEKIQLESFLAITQNDSDLLRQILTILLDELQEFIEWVRKTEELANIESFRRAVHKIIPSLKMLGQMQLISSIEHYKEELIQKDTNTSKQQFDSSEQIVREIRRIRREIMDVLKGL